LLILLTIVQTHGKQDFRPFSAATSLIQVRVSLLTPCFLMQAAIAGANLSPQEKHDDVDDPL